MAIMSLAQRTTTLTITQASWEIRTASTTRAKVLENGYTSQTATAQALGIGRPQAQGVTPVNVLFQGEDPNDTAVSNCSLSWGTSPTVPLQFFRRVSLPATIGSGYIYTFPRGLIVPVSARLVLWNITTALAGDVYTVLDE